MLIVAVGTSSSRHGITSSIGWRGKAESNSAPEGSRATAGVLRPADGTSPRIGAVARGRIAIGAIPARCSALELQRRGGQPRHDPNTPAGTHCLAGRHGNLAVCAVLVWRSAEGSNPPTRQVSIPVFRTGGRPFSRNAPRESGTRGGIRTHTADGLSVVPPADWATRAWCSGRIRTRT